MKQKRTNISLQANLLHNGVNMTVTVKFSTDGAKVIFNARHIYLTISAQERCWFEYLCEEAERYGRVYVGKNEEEAFVEHVAEITGGKLKVNRTNVNNYTRKLVETGLLLQTTSSGLYYINPKYVQLSTQKERIETIEFLFQEANVGKIKNVQKLLGRPMDEIFADDDAALPF